MFDKSFIEKIEQMAAPAVVETTEGAFSKENLWRVQKPLPSGVNVGTLSGLAELVKNEKGKFECPLYVRITSPTAVDVFGSLMTDTKREFPFTAKAKLPEFRYCSYMDIENMIIALK